MIRPRYALKLARTKLHSKQGMLFVSIIISSVLFATLFASIIVFSGAEKSAEEFIRKANNDRYLVEVNPVIPNSAISYSLPLSIQDVHRIKALEKKYYDDIRAKYKQLGLKYDESTEIPALKPSAFLSPTLPEEQRVEVNYESPVVELGRKQKVEEYVASAKNTLADLKTIGSKYGASGYYANDRLGLAGIPNMMLIQDGKENFEDSTLKAGDLSPYGYFTNAVHNGDYAFEDEQLLQRYLLPSILKDPRGVPVIVSAQEAVSLFGKDKGIGEEPKNPLEKAEWLKTVQDKFGGYTYQVCYRNSAEMTKIEKIQRDYADMVNNKDNPDYKKPSLIYDLPKEPCGDVVIKEDTRTAAEKKADAEAIENQKKLGTYDAPIHKLLTFQIVGIVNAQPYSKYTDNIQSYLQNLLSVEGTTFTATIPHQAYEKLPVQLKVDDLVQTNDNDYSSVIKKAGLTTHILEFKTIEDARSFISQETCPSADTECQKLFTSAPYGSNYLILDEIGKMFQRIMLYALPVVLGLALIIIWFTMTRVMMESRKEIAVYRAMGAKRSDIAAIYLTYSLIIAFRIALVSFILGIVAAYAVEHLYAPQLTSIANSAFGNMADKMSFSLFDLSSPLLWLVLIVIFITGIIASIQPLIRNVLRSPINDIRNE